MFKPRIKFYHALGGSFMGFSFSFFLLKGSKERLFIDIDTQSVSLFVSLLFLCMCVCQIVTPFDP